MSALVPYNYRGFSSQKHSGSHKQKKNYYYDQRLMGRQPFVPRPFPSQPYYQPYFYPNNRYPSTGYNQFGRPPMAMDLISLNRSNEQYRYAQYIYYMNMMQKRNRKREAKAMPLPMYTEPFRTSYTTGGIFEYEKETRFVPYPVFLGGGTGGLNIGENLGYGSGLTTTLARMGGGMNLPPKIRVIFIPTGLPSLQQPCTGALCMPPFFFNRMLQPCCSLPLPPPLPQIGSLPLTPCVQQMVMQQYANPVAVLPFTPNWQMPQPMISGYPQIQQQQQQSIMPISSYPQIPQQQQQQQSIMSISSYPQIPQQQQQSLMLVSALQPSQSIPQSNIPPTLLPANIPMLPSYAPSFPLSSDAIPSQAQYSNNGYPSTCRACIPVPPPLNISVTGHCWVQHCCACHHVPTDVTNPNIRPTNGRFTPLLRQPTVQQDIYNPPIQQQPQQQYPYINASVTMRPWLHDMPPLPPGAAVISDEYVAPHDCCKTCLFSQNYAIQQPRVMNSESRSITTINTDNNNINKNRSRKNGHKKHKRHDKSQSNSESKSSISLSNTSRSSTSSSGSENTISTANEQPKPNITPRDSQQNLANEQLSAAARNINLRYNYQPPDLHSVYNNNPYLKSNDPDSTSLSNSSGSPNLLNTKKDNHDNSSSPTDLNSIEEEGDKKPIPTPLPTSSQSKKRIKRIIIIREFTTSSPSTISTISSNQSFNIIDKDFDSISTTSTIKAYETDENTETF